MAKKKANPNGEARGRPEPSGAGRRRELLPTSAFAAALGSRIRRIRLQRGLTLGQAAERTGGQVTLSSWSGYECGASEPKLSKAVAVCRALGVGLDKLVRVRLPKKPA